MCDSEIKDAGNLRGAGNISEEDESMPELEVESEQPSNHRKKLDAIIADFLNREETANAVVAMPMYYGDLLAWALQCFIENSGWHVNRIIGYHEQRPVYSDACVGYRKKQSLLRDGTFFIEKDGVRLVITVNGPLNYVLITGPVHCKTRVDEAANWIRVITNEGNFYRGGKIELVRRIRFIEPSSKTWGDLILDQEIKDEIWENTIGFLKKRGSIRRYGVPAKRGVLLVGSPGTGKTLLCKALMSADAEFTFIKANQKYLDEPMYIINLYQIARDLSPTVVFIEDIDRIAHERVQHGGVAAITTLLDVLDGLEELDEVVTVATTNSLETIDKAFAKRPSRFDRVIELPLPDLELRKELIALICKKVNSSSDNQIYIAEKTEGCTPAHIQEIIYTLVIGHCQTSDAEESEELNFSRYELDKAILKVSRRVGRPLGFILNGNNGKFVDAKMKTAIR